MLLEFKKRTINIQKRIGLVFLMMFYVTEAINKYIVFNYNTTSYISRIVKTIVVLYIIGSLVTKKPYKEAKYIITIIVFFVVGQLAMTSNFDLIVIVNIIKYIFPLILFTYFNYYPLPVLEKKIIVNFFEKIIVFNSALIIIGAVLSVPLFKTYDGSRFGYNGLLITSATATYFYCIAISHLFLKYQRDFFKKRIVILSCIALILVGTKSLYLLTFFTVILFIQRFVNIKVKGLLFLIIISIMVLSFYYIFFVNEIFSSLRINQGILTSILSYRDKILIQKTIPFVNENWNFINYLFGGVNDISKRPQMSFIDLLYFFGIIGSLLYLYVFKLTYFNFDYKKNLFFLYFLILVSFISGNFFLNASLPIYLIILKECNILNSLDKNNHPMTT